MNSAAILPTLGLLAFSAALPVAAQSKPETSATEAAPSEGEAAPASAVTPKLIAQGEKVFQGAGN